MGDNKFSNNQTYSELTNSTSTEKIMEIFKLIELGENNIRNDRKEIILILGVTGSGKTTLAHFLAADNNNLISKEVGNVGEFIIEDKDDKIRAGVVSKTVFPEIILDSETEMAFCDTPGFDDTRGTITDITATYFIKKIIRNVEKVKILLTVNYSSLRTGVDRKDFVNLINHTIRNLKNIKKFENSVALVATKVENSYKKLGNKIVSVSDELLIEYIAEFLRITKDNFNKIAGEELMEQGKQLIDALLIKSEEGYKRIGLFRRPENVGPLSKMEVLQEERIRLKRIIEENLNYTNVNENDFGYSPSEKSKNDIHIIREQINNDIINRVKEIGFLIEKYYKTKEVQSKDVDKLYAEFHVCLEKMKLMVEHIENDLSLKEFVHVLLQFEAELKTNIRKIHISNLLEQDKYLEFLEIVNQRKIENLSLIWKTGLNEIIKYLKSSAIWYKFLVDLYDKLSSYDIQKNKLEFKFMYEKEIQNINDENLKKFVNDNMPSVQFDEIAILKIDDVKLRTLNELIKSVLTATTSSSFDENSKTCEVLGDYIMLSATDQECLQKSKYFNVFAMRKIFVDVDLSNADFNLQHVAFIAPVWEVIRIRKIILNGNDGCCVLPMAENGKYSGQSGIAGIPGEPGESAGHFFGIGKHFINGHNLEIIANGGRGSRGQDGGNGMDGRNGRSPRNGYDKDYFKSSYEGGSFLWIIRDYCIYGENGGDGGNGGNPGIGGKGGLAGNIKLITLSDDLYIKTLSKEGEEGEAGLGGEGGREGYAGKSIIAEKFLWIWNSAYFSHECSQRNNGSPGRRGVDYNKTGIKSPEIIQILDRSTLVNSYRKYFLKNLNNEKIKFDEQVDMFNKLSENTSIIDLYNSNALIEEFFLLQNECAIFDEPYFLSWHQHLLQKVEKYASQQHYENEMEKQKIILSTLYTAIFSRILIMKKKPNIKVVWDIKKYLDSFENDVRDVKFIKNDYYESYEVEIKQMIKRTESFIRKYIKIEIDNLWNLLQENVDSYMYLISDSDNIKNQNISNLRSELQYNLIAMTMVRILHDIYDVLNSALVDIKIQVSKPISISDSLILDKTYFTNIPDMSIETETISQIVSYNHTNYIYETKIMMKNIINNLSNASIPINEWMQIEKYQKQLDNANNTQILAFRNELRHRIEITKNHLQSQEQNEILEKTDQELTKARNIIKMCATGIKDCIKIANNEKLFVNDIAINQVNAFFSEIQLYAEKFDEMLEKMMPINENFMQTNFLAIKVQMQKLKEGFLLSENIAGCFEKVEAGINIMVNLYDVFQWYQVVKTFSINFKNVDLSKKWIFKTNKEINILNEVIRSNILTAMYEDITRKINDFIFPLAPFYSSVLDLHLNEEFNITMAIMDRIKKIKSSVENFGTSLDEKYDKFIFLADFVDSENNITEPFYRWRNKEFIDTISDLLAGKAVILKADITKGVVKQAVKFTEIKIKFKCSSEVLEKELDNDLQDFIVSLTHFGDSVFKCGNDFYPITFETQQIEYSIKKNNKGEPLYTNVVYNKIKNGNFILSPYSFWYVQLKGTNATTNFDKFKKYTNYVDIVLEGRGQFITNTELCSNTLKNYYQVDESISESVTDKENKPYIRDIRFQINRKKSQIAQTNLTNTHSRKRRSINNENVINDVSSMHGEVQYNDVSVKGIINWLTSSVSKVYPEINYYFNKNDVSTSYGDNFENTLDFTSNAHYNINDTLVLTDLLIRLVTKSKTGYFQECVINYENVHICAINIIEEFENILNSMDKKLEFDPVSLMAKLENEIINGNRKKIGQILLDAIKDNSLFDKNDFYNYLKTFN
ncbi:hypothetical protein PGB90_009049 [Kerria lacca]